MSFLNKLGIGKKKDEFDLGSDFDSGLPPDNGATNFGADNPYDPSKFSPGMDSQDDPFRPSFSNTSTGQQSYGQSTNPFSGQAESQNFSQPFQNESFPPSTGQQLARNYVQQESSPPVNSDKMEIINLKLDAIRSELTSLSHRLTSLEQKLGDSHRRF